MILNNAYSFTNGGEREKNKHKKNNVEPIFFKD